MDAWLVVNLVDGCGLQRGDDVLRLAVALVSTLARELYQMELIA